MTKFGKKQYNMFAEHKRPYRPKDPLKVDRRKAYQLTIPVLKGPHQPDSMKRMDT